MDPNRMPMDNAGTNPDPHDIPPLQGAEAIAGPVSSVQMGDNGGVEYQQAIPVPGGGYATHPGSRLPDRGH